MFSKISILVSGVLLIFVSGESFKDKLPPEIEIRNGNGTILETRSKSQITLVQEVAQVKLICSADYPIHWVYLVGNREVSALDIVEFHRNIRNISDYENPSGSRFMSTVVLRGMLESQTGRYMCRNYGSDFEASSYFDIYVPGNHTFNGVSERKYPLNETMTQADIICPVTNNTLNVSLYQLDSPHLNETGQEKWLLVNSTYDPIFGFSLSGNHSELLGTYKCVADNGGDSILVKIVESTDNLASTSDNCWEDKFFVHDMRSQRLQKFCGKGSYGSFMREDYVWQYLPALQKEQPEMWERFKKCGDWRFEEFMENGEDSLDVCFRDKTSFPHEIKLNATGVAYPHGDGDKSYPFTKLTIFYNGRQDAAANFFLAVRRGSDNDQVAGLEFLNIPPSEKYFYPWAHQQAIWRDVIVNGTDIQRVTVFQPHSDNFRILDTGVSPDLTVSKTVWRSIWDFFSG